MLAVEVRGAVRFSFFLPTDILLSKHILMGNFHQDGLTLPLKTTSRISQNNSFQGSGRQGVKGQDPRATGVKGAGHPAHFWRWCLGCGLGVWARRLGWAKWLPSDSGNVAPPVCRSENCTDRCLGHLQTVPSSANSTHMWGLGKLHVDGLRGPALGAHTGLRMVYVPTSQTGNPNSQVLRASP